MKGVLLHAAVVILTCICAATQSQYKVLYSFGTNGSEDAREPNQGFAYRGGVLYGTTVIGGSNCPQYGGCGTVFALEDFFGTAAEAVLYSFCTTNDPTTCPDGAFPEGGLILDSKGNLYGATPWGGSATCPMGEFETCGTVFELKRSGQTWTEVVLHSFDGSDGAGPVALMFDSAGNLYGTADGGTYGAGTVFELTPNPDDTWTEKTLHNFDPAAGDGAEPVAGLEFDHAGNLYGATSAGGKIYKSCPQGCGTVFQLSPNGDGTWSETAIFQFGPNQPFPNTALVLDEAGNIYGTTAGTGSHNISGTAFRLVPEGGNWKASFYAFNGLDGFNPTATLLLQGNAAYGTTSQTLGINCQFSCGNIFKIQGGTETVLYTFCLQGDFCPEGDEPSAGGPLLAGDGNLYGGANTGGAYGFGLIFQLTP